MRIHLSSRALWRTFLADWWGTLKRTWAEIGGDNIQLIAAGTAFYAFASIAPVLAATVLVYGIVATPEMVQENIRALFSVLPQDAASLIGGQLDTVVSGTDGKKGFGLLLAIAVALYGGSKAASSMITALNVAFEVKEERNIVMTTLTALAMVAGGIVLMLAGVAASTVTAFLSSLMPWAPGIVLTAIGLSSYVLMALIAVTGASLLYRFGPHVPRAHLRWGTPGAVLATAVWLVATAGFGIYVSNFGNYGATYGALSSIIVLLTWLWLSAYAFLAGAELDHAVACRVAQDEPPIRQAAVAAASPPPRAGVVKGAALAVLGLALFVARGRRQASP